MNKRYGIGSLSLLLVILAFLWAFTLNGVCLGDKILNLIHLPAWSNGASGTHYTVFYAHIFLIPAFILSICFPNDKFSTVGKALSCLFMFILFISQLFMM